MYIGTYSVLASISVLFTSAWLTVRAYKDDRGYSDLGKGAVHQCRHYGVQLHKWTMLTQGLKRGTKIGINGLGVFASSAGPSKCLSYTEPDIKHTMGVPDEQIHPVATGEAAKTVAKHEGAQDLVFYAGWVSFTSRSSLQVDLTQSTWTVLSLCAKDMDYIGRARHPVPIQGGKPLQEGEALPRYAPYQHAHIALTNVLPDINPKGLVPAVEYQGKALYESLILCEFLEDAYPSYKPNILPTDPWTRAYVRIWVDFVNKNLVPGFMRLIIAQDPEKRKEYLQEVYNEQKKFAEQVKGPYFLGKEFSLVDVAIAPWIVRDYISTEHRGYRREDAGEAWKKYADVISQRPSVHATSSVSIFHSSARLV